MQPNDPIPPIFLLKSGLNVDLPVAVEASISADFKDKQLVPLIFSHGLTACAKMHSVMCKEFASYGMLVIALDHLDESCGYTINQNT